MKKNLIVKQRDLKDCGVCSLLSIMKYYNGYVPLETLRIDTKTTTSGTTAYDLVQTAINYGFDSYGIRVEDSDLSSVIKPAIAHVVIDNLNHFVVIYKIDKIFVHLMDPAKGFVKMKIQDFLNIWSQNLIILYPKYSLPHKTCENQILKTIFKIFQNEKLLNLRIIILSLFFTLFTIITSFTFKVLINELNQNSEKKLIMGMILFFFSLFIIKIIVYYLRNYYKNLFHKKFDGILYTNFLNHLFALPNYFVKDRTTGEIMVRLKELGSIKEVFSKIMITIFLDSILAISVGIFLYLINKQLFFILCLFLLVYLLVGGILGKILYKRAVLVTEQEINFETNVLEDLDFFLTIKNLNLKNKRGMKLEKNCIKYLEQSNQLNLSAISFSTIIYGLEEILKFSILAFGILAILNKELTLIDFITFESLTSIFMEPFKNLINIIPSLSFVKVSIEKLNDFYNINEEDIKTGLEVFQNGDIVISNLDFSYNPFKKIFNQFNLEIKENSFVFFKGPSGCGKSTLCQIISRLVDTNSKILINNINIRDYSLDTIRKNITYISQKECLIQDTIKNNIILERNINEEKLREIINICELENIVDNKPLRYETFLSKDATNISGGEKQRIILARALLNDFKILILDEALSEVNSELENKIIKNLKTFLKDKTVIYVSHKKNERYFDKVYEFKAAT